ncbi:hypothetical protein NMG60_11028033 [Bertholletia excelsa]
MVVKMMKWSPWPPPAPAKRFEVKVNKMEVEGFVDGDEDGDTIEKVMVIEVRWKGGQKAGLVPLIQRPPSRKRPKHISKEAIVKKGEPVKWDDEFDHICSFPVVSKDGGFGLWDASFKLRYGAKADARAKLAVVGHVSVNLGELASEMKPKIETKLPVTREATLSMCLSFVEVRNSLDSPVPIQNLTESKNVGTATDGSAERRQVSKSQGELRLNHSDDSVALDSSRRPETDLSAMRRIASTSSVTEAGSAPSPEPVADSGKKAGLFSWKRRRLSLKPGKTKVEPLIKKTADVGDDDGDVSKINMGTKPNCASVESIYSNSLTKLEDSGASCDPEGSSTTCQWEEKELLSRDGGAKLKANVFLASFDQCSDKAAGESACTTLVVVIAHWLLSNQQQMPTRSEFDRLIMDGSSEWRKLCDNQDLISHFPNKHFDLETVVEAGIRPISILREKSFIGFFSADKFESLKEAMSFDQIWDKINGDNRPSIYIVSWNDHFFILKVDANAYYIIDTLGERLFEGCNQAFILRFDKSSQMQGNVEKEKDGSGELSAGDEHSKCKEASEEEICRGKECCREFIKRFLAAIPLGELESEEQKGPVSYFDLHQRLQIEFNFSSLLVSPSLPSSFANSNSSLFSTDSIV